MKISYWMILVADTLRRMQYFTRPALLASFLFGLSVLALLSACSNDAQRDQLRLSGATMGTRYHITLVTGIAAESEKARKLQEGIDELLEEINQSMSTYIAKSEINKLAAAPIGNWTPVSPALLQVLLLSREVSKLSGGAFDITVRPLIDLWGFGPQPGRDVVPDADAISRLVSSIGYRQLLIDAQGSRVQRLADISLDLSAVAKGYAVDRIAEHLAALGYDDVLVEIGGELALRGTNGQGRPWRIAVERPQSASTGDVFKALQLSDRGLATSGDYRNYFEQDGVRYSHTLDPRNGRPISHNLVSVTVVDSSTARADALATAFNVLGVDQALALANSENIAALFIIKQADGFGERASEAFMPYFEHH